MRFPGLALMILLLATALAAAGCAPKMRLFGEPAPLTEVVLQGKGTDKVLLLNIRGVISNSPKQGLFTTRPGMVQQVAARLEAARKDTSIRALLLVVDSPGGGVTASDVLQHELTRFKQDTGATVVALFMEMAASGGYYIATAADGIVAHPSTVTGSIGTVFMRPQAAGLMEKIGVEAVVTKSGKLKDMGSPFREGTPEEDQLFQTMIDEMNARFQWLVRESRHLTPAQAARIADARILTAEQAKETGLVDRIGYFEDALAMVREKTGLSDPKVVVYRDGSLPNDTVYNTAADMAAEAPALISIDLARYLAVPRTGFYYLWAPEYTR